MTENIKPSKTLIRSLTASTTPQQVCTSNPKRTCIMVQVTNGYTAYITSSQKNPYTEGVKVTASLPYESYTTTAELWILTASGTAACIIQEDSD